MGKNILLWLIWGLLSSQLGAQILLTTSYETNLTVNTDIKSEIISKIPGHKNVELVNFIPKGKYDGYFEVNVYGVTGYIHRNSVNYDNVFYLALKVTNGNANEIYMENKEKIDKLNKRKKFEEGLWVKQNNFELEKHDDFTLVNSDLKNDKYSNETPVNDDFIDNDGVVQTIFYNNDFIVVPNKYNAEYYVTFTRDQHGKIIDYVRLYSINKDYMISKYEAISISTKASVFDVLNGERITYDEDGNIRRKTLHINQEKLPFGEYLTTRNDIVFEFDRRGSLTQYIEYKKGNKIKIVKYNNAQEIVYAADKNEKFFYQGNPSSGYELTYNEEFGKEKVFPWNIRNTALAKTSYVNNGYLMESKNNGGISDIIDVDFDMNSSDWVITCSFDRVASIEGTGIVIGTNEDATSVQMFMISGDSYFNHYNIYNGFNISELNDWMYTNTIKGGYTDNTISIMKVKDRIFVSINGRNTYQTKFTSLSSNTIGLFVDKIGNKAKFRRLVIKKLNSSIPEKFYNPKTYIAAANEFKGNGTGFLLNNTGYLATNYHVIENANEIYTEIKGKDYKCKLIAVDRENDLAILKVMNKDNFEIYSTLTSNNTATGSEIFVLGYPYAISLLGNEIKLTDGKISSQTGFKGETKTYQISAPIQPGNSGGPLFNNDGDIVGIVSSKFTAGENVGYAIKISYLTDLLSKNGISYNKNNLLKNYSLVKKVELLSNTTFLIKTK